MQAKALSWAADGVPDQEIDRRQEVDSDTLRRRPAVVQAHRRHPADPSARYRTGQPIGTQAPGDHQLTGVPRSPTVRPHPRRPRRGTFSSFPKSNTRSDLGCSLNKDPKPFVWKAITAESIENSGQGRAVRQQPNKSTTEH